MAKAEERASRQVTYRRIIGGQVPKGRRGNNFTFLAEDFRRQPRSVDEGISAIFRGGATKAGGEKTSQECEVIFASALSETPNTVMSHAGGTLEPTLCSRIMPEPGVLSADLLSGISLKLVNSPRALYPSRAQHCEQRAEADEGDEEEH